MEDSTSLTTSRRVAYVHSESLLAAADLLPANIGRATLVHQLVHDYDLLESEAFGYTQVNYAKVVPSQPATRAELLAFHDAKFIGTGCAYGNLVKLDQMLGTESSKESDSDLSESSSSDSEDEEDRPSPRKRPRRSSFGLQDDCPLFDGIADYVTEVAGASLTAARQLLDDKADVAIAWTGGRHHAQRGKAAGFCYVADIVLSILTLRRSKSPPRPNILYLDLDLHHGDAVESAFASTPTVLTLSLHLHAKGFFPATGSLVPPTRAKSNALNIPLEPGFSKESLRRTYKSCIRPTIEGFEPDYIVIQCGCDGLAGDPCREWNLDLEGIGEVVEDVLAMHKPTLLLGGGGYRNESAARCWTYLTSIALGRKLKLDDPIPSDTEAFEMYAPSCIVAVPAGNMRDLNTEATLAKIEETFASYPLMQGKAFPKSIAT